MTWTGMRKVVTVLMSRSRKLMARMGRKTIREAKGSSLKKLMKSGLLSRSSCLSFIIKSEKSPSPLSTTLRKYAKDSKVRCCRVTHSKKLNNFRGTTITTRSLLSHVCRRRKASRHMKKQSRFFKNKLLSNLSNGMKHLAKHAKSMPRIMALLVCLPQ